MIVVILILIVIVAAFIAASIGIGKLKNRASNQIRGKFGLDDSNIYGTVVEGNVNTMVVKKLVKAHPEYTDESIKQAAVNVVNGIINNTIPGQADDNQNKIRSNKMFQEHMPNCKLRRVNIMSYNEKKDTYSDSKNDYTFNISVQFAQQGLVLQYAAFSKGHANGF